ncbi:hypothetical protein ABT369_39535 [Dactylosporangium sp. NPDC000244]|uniref:hypothetical protein n=1 Tax=Dactylosporangium sp. NPDC000244 TaxID=3154365 RepID=UPI003321E14C
MTDLKDMTAAELAYYLGALEQPGSRHSTGSASMLDEATMAFGSMSPQVAEAHAAFAQARQVHQSSIRTSTSGDYSDEAWDSLVAAANNLATQLGALGDARVARYKRKAGWGTCNLLLPADGECRSTLGHLD